MQDLSNVLFKPYTLVVIRLADGETIQGTVQKTEDNSIIIAKEDGTNITVDQELLSNAEYCYTGFPTLVEKIEPLMVEGNGTVNRYEDKIGYVFTNARAGYMFQESTLVDPQLREDALNGCIVGSSVLYVIPENQKSVLPVASVIKAGTLDDVLDKIAMLASKGKVTLAYQFCEFVQKQYPEDEDVHYFYDILKKAAEKAKPLDFYSDLPIPPDDELEPYGRIFEVTEEGGYIIDVLSHEKLFFYSPQLLGGLERYNSEKLIGQPVLYSVKKGNSWTGPQARTVMPPMPISQAYRLAKNLYIYGQKLSACDVLRLIMEQTGSSVYSKEFDAWSQSPLVRGKLWDNELLDEYDGKPEQLFLPSPSKEESLILRRNNKHDQLLTELTGTPKVPVIMSELELASLKASISSIANDNSVVVTEEDDDDLLERGQKTAVQSFSSELPTLDNCPHGHDSVDANATIMVAWRDGTLFVKGEDRPFKFRVEDIIDEELRARAEMYSTKFIQDEPVVCKLFYTEHRATHICPPKTVYEMLLSARNAIMSARMKDPVRERETIFSLYDAADGYAGIVLDMIPDHSVASRLKEIAEKALKDFQSTCYKAPFNAVKPCGMVLSHSKKLLSYKVQDPLFSDFILLPDNSIVDKGIKKLREGDELVYSVYPGKRNRIPQIRFACLARPAVDLIEMAEQWERESNYENAWGIAMNVLDFDPQHSDAVAIIERCRPKVSATIVDERQQVLREDLFAQGRIATDKDQYEKAIELFSRILESQDENQARKTHSVLNILSLYNSLLLKNPKDGALRSRYRVAGEKYILNKHNSPYSLPGKTMEEIDAFLLYYSDMGDIAGLLDSYRRKLELLNRQPESDLRRNAISEVNASISWNLLLSGDRSDEPRIFAERALKEGNDDGRVCEAIFRFRLGEIARIIHEQGNFAVQGLAILTEGYAAKFSGKIHKLNGEWKSLEYERFALLCAIINDKRKAGGQDKLLHYLGRYVATLSLNESEYLAYLSSTRSIPDDCNFIRQMFRCLNNAPTSHSWMDIRLVCMLSEEAAYNICCAMYCLDPSVSANVLIRSGIDIYQKPSASVFARGFAQWRGATVLAKYNDFINKVESLGTEIDLTECIEFFRDLKFESWMIQDEQELINDFHWQLPDLLSSFMTAESSRSIKTTSRSILSIINEWLDIIKDRPTVLMQCALSNLLILIRQTVARIESEQHYSEPVLKAKVLTTSVLDANGMLFLELEIRNKDKRAEPMLDCQLRLVPTGDIIPDATSPVVTYSETERVFGDESIIYILCFKINAAADFTNLALKLHFEYRVKTSPRSEDFILKFKPLKKWVDIENFFNPGAPEYNHFYGRQAYIKKVVSVFSDPKNTPHFFIYGQKRSGKSSVLFQIQKQLEEKIPSAILVKVDFLGLELKAESDFYHLILKRILQTVGTMNKKAKKDPDKDLLDPNVLTIPKKEETDYDVLLERLWALKDVLQETRGWENSRLILFIDEFTIAYEGLLDHLIPKEFMHRWKSLQAEGLFGAVLVGQDVLHAFINETEGPNAFDILDKERLNYLEPEEAERLITETMEVLSQRKDVFVGNAVKRILYYSASSAHYTKWVCSKLVDYMNTRRLPKVTVADVDAVVRRSIRNTQPTGLRGLFDPLLFPGLKEKLARFTREQTMRILDTVADEELRNPVRGCRKVDLLARSGETHDEIIKDLVERGVLENDHDYFKIKLKLYIVWYQVRNTLITY